MSQETNIHALDPLAGERWDDLTASHPRASFFHSSHWARVLRASYGHELHYLVEMDGEEPLGLLPILEVNSPWTGRRGVTLPFSDECGLLCFNGTDGRGLIQHALELGRRRGWKYFELRGDVPGDPLPTKWESYVGHEVDLTVGVDKLLGGFESSVRRAIRKAEKAGLTVRVLDTLAATRIFYALHCRTRRKHGVPPQPFSFFLNICEHVLQKGSGFIVTVEHQGRAIAAGVFVHHGRVGLYKFGASEEASLRLRPNDLVMWEAIKWYAARGYATFSMGRTAPGNAGLRRFKCGFGAREKPINYFRYDLGRQAFVAGRDEKTGPVNMFLTLAPLPVLRMIGRALYPHLD
jgi:CelD/BcsL family acetyltransferase involved in cellulose biosynthesis